MNNNITLPALLFICFQISCADANNEIKPNLNKNAFDGFTIQANTTKLNGYEYSIGRRKEVTFKTCKDALNYDISKIPEFEYFRFKLLLTSCTAINKFKSASLSKESYFPDKFTDSDIKSFPALATPFLSKSEYTQRKDKTINKAHKELQITSDKNGTKLLTKDDEIYIHILGRGDFNGDKIEDLLVSSEWYARHAHGKHTDLVILSKTGKNNPIAVIWRMHGANW